MIKPLVYANLPDTLLEVFETKTDMLYYEFRENYALPNFHWMPYISLGVGVNITTLEVYEINASGADTLRWSTFDKYSLVEGGVTYYKAKPDITPTIYDPGIYYYLVNGTKYTQAFQICKQEWKIKFWHQDSLQFGLYFDDPTIYYDEISFYTQSLKPVITENLHTVVKKNGLTHIASAYRHRKILIEAYVPYYLIEKLHDIKYFSHKKLLLLQTSRVSYDEYDIEEIDMVVIEGSYIMKVEITILPTTSIKEYTYQQSLTLGAGGGTPVGLTVSNLADVLTATPANGSGDFTVQWFNDGILVGAGLTFDTSGVEGDYIAVVLDNQTGLTATDSHTITDLCSNYSVTHQISPIVGSSTKLLTISTNGVETVVYGYEYSADNVTFAPTAGATNTLVILTTGYYRYTVTDANGCQKIYTEYIEIATHTVSITRATNTLSAVVVGCTGVLTYQWSYDIGAGKTALTGETGSDYEALVNAMYYCVATCDGTPIEAEYLVLDISGSTFAVVINEVYLDGGTQKCQAELINPPSGTIAIDWYQLIAGTWTQIGSGVTQTLTSSGYIKVFATDDHGNVVADALAYTVTGATEYQKFIITGALESTFTVTAFTLADPSALTANEINALYLVTRGGVVLTFNNVAAASLGRDEYNITYATNIIGISTAVKIYEHEIIEIIKI